MSRLFIKGAEAALPTSTGTGTSISQARVVRLVNTASGADHLVTVQVSAGGTTVGSLTVMRSSSVVIEKKSSHIVWAADAAVKASAVGFTN